MTIGVLSDTHIPKRAKTLPPVLLDAFTRVDHIVHAGDIISLDVLKQLNALAPVTAVAGNVDPPELRDLLGEKKILSIGGFKIGLTHGHGSKGSTISRSLAAFENETLDCIIFGHSHIPYCRYHESTLMFNPGSPTDKRRNQQYSFGIIELFDTLRAKHIFF